MENGMPPDASPWHRWGRTLAGQLAAAAGCGGGGLLLGLCLPAEQAGLQQLGLPFALALLLRGGAGLWPGLVVGMGWLAWREPGPGWAGILLLSASGASAALLGASAARTRRRPFQNLAGALAFLGGPALLASALAALGRLFAMLPAHGQASAQWLAELCRAWLGNLAAVLALTPLLLLAGMPTGRRLRPQTVFAAAATLGLALLLGVVADGRGGDRALLPILLILPLLWLAFHGRLLLAHALSLAIVASALAGVRLGQGALATGDAGHGLLNVAVLCIVQSATLLAFGALLAERRGVERDLLLAKRGREAKAAERTRQLAESEARLRLMADAAPFPLAMNRLAGGELIYANARAEELFGARLRPDRPLRVQDFYADPAEREKVARALLEGRAVRDREVRLRDAGGRPFWALVSCELVQSGETWYVINGVNDISERKRLEQSLQDANAALRSHLREIELLQQGLREQALRDPLTGLFNRRHLDDILPRVLAHMLALHREVAVLMVDADHFKRINDTYGHRCGDAVLTALGACLSDHFRSGDIVCRYGGEEFFVLLPGATLEAAYAKAEGLRRAVGERPMEALGHSLAVTLSIGLALCPLHGNDAESVVRAADEALYQAKRQGRDRVCVAARLQSLLS
ncbi:GGDEF domain protein [Chromobacterium violaceum]